jgi:hypothetical protein
VNDLDRYEFLLKKYEIRWGDEKIFNELQLLKSSIEQALLKAKKLEGEMA